MCIQQPRQPVGHGEFLSQLASFATGTEGSESEQNLHARRLWTTAHPALYACLHDHDSWPGMQSAMTKKASCAIAITSRSNKACATGQARTWLLVHRIFSCARRSWNRCITIALADRCDRDNSTALLVHVSLLAKSMASESNLSVDCRAVTFAVPHTLSQIQDRMLIWWQRLSIAHICLEKTNLHMSPGARRSRHHERAWLRDPVRYSTRRRAP